MAAVIVAVLADERSGGRTWDLTSGTSPIGVALQDAIEASGKS